jgi:hypothetical protein
VGLQLWSGSINLLIKSGIAQIRIPLHPSGLGAISVTFAMEWREACAYQKRYGFEPLLSTACNFLLVCPQMAALTMLAISSAHAKCLHRIKDCCEPFFRGRELS